MFWATKKFGGRSHERVISLAMVPILLLGTIPHAACICADGHREKFCRARMGITAGAPAVAQKRNCCRRQVAPVTAATPLATTCLARPKSCCRPVLELPFPVTDSVKNSSSPQPQLTIETHVCDSQRPSALSPILERAPHSSPPPLDAPIVYSRLTI